MSEPRSKDYEELLHRRLVESVSAEVRKRVVPWWMTALIAGVAVAGYVGFSLVSDIKSKVEEYAQAEIDASLGKIKEATAAAEDLPETIRRQQAIIEEQLAMIQEGVLRARQRSEDAAVGIQAAALDMQVRVETVQRGADDALQQYDALRQRLESGQTYAAAGTVADLAKALADIERRLDENEQRQNEIVARANLQMAALSRPDTGLVNAAVRQATALPPKNTVYFQFATLPRDEAQDISTLLRESGFDVPGEERRDDASRLREVRYFYEQDKDAAIRLASETQTALVELGYPETEIAVRATQVNTKPKQGVLELWLGLQPLRAEAPGPAITDQRQYVLPASPVDPRPFIIRQQPLGSAPAR